MNGGIKLGSVRGVEIVADASAAVLAVLFGAAVFVELLSGDLAGSNERALVLASICGVLIVVSVFLHEVAHAVVGSAKGQRVLGIRLFIFGGYSVIEGEPSPVTELQVALAGPAASVLLGLVFWIVGALAPGGDVTSAANALAIANVAIGLFNLFPGFPLDGGRVLRGLIAARGTDPLVATKLVATVGRYTGWVVLAIGVGLLVRTEAVGLFWIVAGWFLATTAVQTGRREMLAQAFAGQTAGSVMHPVIDAVPGSMYVSSMVDLYAMGHDLRTQVVEVDGRVVGVIGRAELGSAAPARWVSTAVTRLMTSIGPDDIVDVDEPLENLVIRPVGHAGRIVVVDGGVVVGIIEPRNLETDKSYA